MWAAGHLLIGEIFDNIIVKERLFSSICNLIEGAMSRRSHTQASTQPQTGRKGFAPFLSYSNVW